MIQEWMGDRWVKGVVLLALLAGVAALAAYTHLAYREAQSMSSAHSISVQGKAEAFVKPDIAEFSYSVLGEGADATAAQNKSAEAGNAIKAYLKEQGVEERDIKTVNYTVSQQRLPVDSVPCSPWGPCPPVKTEVAGYTAEETVTVKVRKIESVGALVSGIGERGATNVSNVNFTIDDIEKAKEGVRADAIADAQEKAQLLARSLGVRLGKLVSYSEGYSPVPYRGYVGAMMENSMEDAAIAPNVAPGENQVVMEVSLNYEIH